jgi:hypothetical protein
MLALSKLFGAQGIGNRAGAAHLWVRAVGIEHGVILVRVVLLLFLPTYPSWIGDAKDGTL